MPNTATFSLVSLMPQSARTPFVVFILYIKTLKEIHTENVDKNDNQTENLNTK